MNLGREQLIEILAATHFRMDTLEKALRLLSLLESLRSHPFLKNRWALKGGTALNLFHLDLPRLSVDIDLNYIGSPDRRIMLDERPKFESAVEAACAREGLAVRRGPSDEHAGGKFSLRYQSPLGGGGTLDVDLNYLSRVPLWPVVELDSRSIGPIRATGIPVLAFDEIVAGKLKALFSRHAGRDLFDAHQIFTQRKPDRASVRLAFVVLGGTDRRDWRKVTLRDISFKAHELRDQVIPLLRDDAIASMGPPRGWGARVVRESRKALGAILPLSKAEREFLRRLNDRGEIDPALLTKDVELADRIRLHPGLQWKALNVRQHRGL